MTYPTIEQIVKEMILPNLMDEISEWSGELAGKYGQSDGSYYVDEIKNEVIRQLTPPVQE
jgi:hypothetical protein